MVELGRFAQTAALREKGWTQDDECQRLQWGDERIGGGTYMKDPDGKLYSVGGGMERLLEGQYQFWFVELPEPGRSASELHTYGPTRDTVTYRGGLRVYSE